MYFSVTLAKPNFKDLTLHACLTPDTAHLADYGKLNGSIVIVPAESTGQFFVLVPTVLGRVHEPDENFALIVTGAALTVNASSTITANVS